MSDAHLASDIRAGGWLDRRLPPGWLPYARLARVDRPIGTWLLLFPCWWGMLLAWAAPGIGRGAWPDLGLAALFALGALAMRGAGCTLNDLVDRDIDGKVARTALRPIPSGAVSPRQAAVFLALLLAIGGAVLLSLNRTAILVGLGSLPLVAIYPFMKRVTYWPQAFLGLAFNWGALVGWAAVAGRLDGPALALYAAGIAWTLGYDTIYAQQDKEDDALIGVRSTALLFGARSKAWIAGFYAAALALLALAGALAGVAWPFGLALAGAGLQLAWQVAQVDLDRPQACLAVFRSNRWAGWIVVAGLLAAGAVARA